MLHGTGEEIVFTGRMKNVLKAEVTPQNFYFMYSEK